MTTPSIKTSLMTLHALTFLHPGTGQTTGVVDLPVQREMHTGFPMIASSGLKGSMREKAEQEWGNGDPKVNAIFGPDTRSSAPGTEAAGALIVTDARILAFPVRSLQQVFVWVTCPMVLIRFGRDLDLIRFSNGKIPKEFKINKEEACPAKDSNLEKPLVLEELRFELIGDAGKRGKVADFAGLIQGKNAIDGYAPSLKKLDFKERLVVIHDDAFQYLVRHATQVSARIALDEEGKKTTSGKGGNLWYEETLPPETLMYALLRAETPRFKGSSLDDADAVATEIQTLLDGKYLQVGGNETVGQGWCQVKLTAARQQITGGTPT